MKKILLVIMIMGIAAGIFTAVQNDAAEWQMRDVEIAVDFDDVMQLARDANMTMDEMLVKLRDLGVTAVGTREAAVQRYRRFGALTVVQGSDIIHNWRLTGEAHPVLVPLLVNSQIRPNTTYILLSDEELAARLVRKAELKLQKPVRAHLEQQPLLVEIDEDLSRVLSLRIGLDPNDTALLRSAGLRMVPRPDNAFLKSEEAVTETLDEFLSLPQEFLSAIVFEGTEVTGFPKHLGPAAEAIRDAGLPFGIIEFLDRQAGIDALSAKTGYRTVLVHPNQPGKTAQSIVNSVRERRVRVVYLRFPLTEPDAVDKSLDLVAGAVEALTTNGYRGGAARAVELPGHGPVQLLLILLGVAAAAALLVAEILRSERCPLWLVFIAALAGLLALFPLVSLNLALQLVSLLAVIIFSALAVVSQQLNRQPAEARDSRGALLWALATLVRTFLLVAAGGALVVALTSAPVFAGGTALFRGVKLVHVLPLLLIVPTAVARVYYHDIVRWTPAEAGRVLREMFARPVLVSYVITFTALAVAAVFYVGRTGHTGGIPVPGLELRIRELLDTVLLVRPRFKEFLIGYPLAVVALALLAKGSRSALTTVLLCAAAIAPISMANTFMHFTTPTPFYSALLRSFNGLWTGMLIGAALYGTLLLLASLWEKALNAA